MCKEYIETQDNDGKEPSHTSKIKVDKDKDLKDFFFFLISYCLNDVCKQTSFYNKKVIKI